MGLSATAPWIKFYGDTPANIDYPRKTMYQLIRETAKLFGYTRSGGVIEAAVNAGIACAEARGLLTIDSSDKIVLK